MIVEVLKKDLIARLRKQPLCRGMFFEAFESKPLKACRTCAVGCLVALAVRDSEDSYDANFEFMLDSRLVGLSDIFEEEGDLEKGRRAALDYVKDHFPNKIPVNIGNLKPRRGVKKVK